MPVGDRDLAHQVERPIYSETVDIVDYPFLLRFLVFTLLLFSFAAAGCRPEPESAKQFRDLGVSFEYPSSWSAKVTERLDNLIIVNTTQGGLQRDSAQIEIIVSESPEEFIPQAFDPEIDLDHISRLYGVQEVQIVKPVATREYNGNLGKSVTVLIPTSSMTAGSRRNQTGKNSPSVMQPLKIIYFQSRTGQSVLIWWFMSLDEEINAEAEKIIDSIHFDPPTRTPESAAPATGSAAGSTPPIYGEARSTPAGSAPLPPVETSMPDQTAVLPPRLPPTGDAAHSRVCRTAPTAFSFREALDISGLVHLRFENDDLLTFEGWTGRPDPTFAPMTPEPTPEFRPGPNASSRILLVGGQLDLSTGTFSANPLEVDAPFGNPCGEPCPLEVITQSPDDRWQLIQVNDWVQSKMGIWLVGQTNMLRIVPYVSGPSWRWIEDNALLWFVSNNPNDLGSVAFLIQLTDPPLVKPVDEGSPLDPFLFFPEFSPLNGNVVSVPSFEQGYARAEEIYQIELHDLRIHATETRTVPGILSASWNEATNQFILQVSEEEEVEIQNLAGDTLLSIPRTTLNPVFPAAPLPTEPIRFSGVGNPGSYALSASGARLAVASSSRIWVFECTE